MKAWQILLLCSLVIVIVFVYTKYDSFYDYTFNADQARRNASDWGGEDYTRKDPITGTVTEVSSGHLDPSCPKGQYSKKTGGVCSGDPLPDSPMGTYEPGAGDYDRNPNKPDSVDYTDTDVLKSAGKITYPDWITDRASSSFHPRLDTSNDLSGTKPDTPKFKDSSDSKWDAIRELNLKKSRGSSRSRDSTEIAYSKIKKGRPSVDELIKSKYTQSKPRKHNHRERDYIDSRLVRDYDRRERQFDLPSRSSYEYRKTKGYEESCNLKSYDSDDSDECC